MDKAIPTDPIRQAEEALRKARDFETRAHEIYRTSAANFKRGRHSPYLESVALRHQNLMMAGEMYRMWRKNREEAEAQLAAVAQAEGISR